MDKIFEIMYETKPNQVEQVKFKTDTLRKYFPKDYTAVDIENAILQILDDRQRKKESNKDAR